MTTWDVVVIGAGPAGSLSAFLLARAGARVVLVERKAFPRFKVCGGCLNASAIATLNRAGLGGRLWLLGARPIEAVVLRHRSRRATIAVPPGVAVSRMALDATLAEAAEESGACFMPETTALVVPEGVTPAHEGWRQVSLQPRHGMPATVRARVVLVADGLAHASLRECASLRSVPARHARVGVGGLGPAGTVEVSPAAITMAVSRHGYVGAVEVEDGRVNVAAALDPDFLKSHAHASQALAAILADAGVGFGQAMNEVAFAGTIPLTRRMTHPAARRLFVLGDAAGYVEPFTGEGMAWACAAAEAVAPLAMQAIAAWQDGLEEDWVRAYGRRIGREQRWCRGLARALRTPVLVAALMPLLERRPGIARPVLAHLHPRGVRPGSIPGV